MENNYCITYVLNTTINNNAYIFSFSFSVSGVALKCQTKSSDNFGL